MEPSYLRVKNWSDFQHYADRRPPWIKLYNDLLEDDAFMRLNEFAQWQLVRVWMVASKSSALTLDEHGRQVPVVANDATSLQRSISSVKKVPLPVFVREGFLIPVAEDELVPPVEKAKRRRGASKTATKPPASASTALAVREHGASATLRGREAESREVELDQDRRRQDVAASAALDGVESLPIDFEKELLVARLMDRIGDHADDGTRRIVRSYAVQLPPAGITKVIESIDIHKSGIADRARYAVGALRNELDERSAA